MITRFSVLVATVALLSGCSGGSGSNGEYSAAAKSLGLTASEAYYKEMTSSVPVQEPETEAIRDGFEEGWRSVYADGDRLEYKAEVKAYVYDGSESAANAFKNGCVSCSYSESLGNIHIRTTHDRGAADGVPVLLAFAFCKNVYLAVLTQPTTEFDPGLTNNVRYLIGKTYEKATRLGLTDCSAGF